ncbi:unnamed protein product [Gongylonema pulchrum]|uniref:SCP domain-containing protein n=1 Tax=Gongylonema pulchrum TaxID=637853 RepID=A0A183DG45_9BILA|nr:unnamed protein product [Gongylonema pulchrum]
MKQFEESVQYNEGRYSVKWPCKSESNALTDNYVLSLGKLKPTARRLKLDPELFKTYDETFKEQLEKGIIETCDGKVDGPVYYMPVITVIIP